MQKALINDFNDTLSFLEDKYGALFPVCVYDEGIFSCYPIILKDFELTNEDMMQEFIIDTLPIAETSFDYLIMLCCNEKGELYNNALKFPKRLFSNLKEILNGIKEDELEPLNSPYPIEVSEDILNCFECDLIKHFLKSNGKASSATVTNFSISEVMNRAPTNMYRSFLVKQLLTPIPMVSRRVIVVITVPIIKSAGVSL